MPVSGSDPLRTFLFSANTVTWGWRMISLIGATSRLGTVIAARLLAAGISFRAACRTTPKAQGLADRGIDIVPIDLERGTGLSQAVDGCSQVICCLHGLMGTSRNSIRKVDEDGHAALIEASVKAGVSRFVYTSALGASHDHPSEFWRAKARTEERLKASGLEFVIIRPSAFMDLYAHELIGKAVLNGKQVVLLGEGRTARNLVAVDDVAAAAVLALTRADFANQTIEIGGWESLSDRDVVAVYEQVAGRKAKVIAVPSAALQVLAAAISPFHAGVGRLMRLPKQLAGRADLHLDASFWSTRLGIDPVRLSKFAASEHQETR